ncbi:MAG: nucleoside triphosphate pyrophosphohydrolase [Pseudomonadales bacterium]
MSKPEPYSLEDLVYLMQRLRDPEDGCPWDLKQTFASIVPYTLEECYEVVDCIERSDWEHLGEELGDLLFQVVFYAQLGAEEQRFDLAAVIDTLVKKLVRRHPHVFPDEQLRKRHQSALSERQINDTWAEIKAGERARKAERQEKKASVLDDVPQALPSIQRAQKLQARAAKVGFDWGDPLLVLDKIEEEIAELREAISLGQVDEIRDEMGDLLFAQVNLARHLGVSADVALRSTNQKFTRRFNHVEAQVEASQKSWQSYELKQLDLWWDEAKRKGL